MLNNKVDTFKKINSRKRSVYCSGKILGGNKYQARNIQLCIL